MLKERLLFAGEQRHDGRERLCIELRDSSDACRVPSCRIKSNLFAQNTSHFNAASGKAVDELLVFNNRILCCNDTNNIFFCFHERYWTAPSYFPSSVLVKSLYYDIIFVVIKCTVL